MTTISKPPRAKHSSVQVRVRFEAAHRLPVLGGKCLNLHGHSWQAWITLSGSVDPGTGVLTDFGPIKSAVQGWVDAHLDHATMLGADDPLVDALAHHGLRHYVIGADEHAHGLAWPTVETVAEVLWRVADTYVTRAAHAATVTRVMVTETANNRATITAEAA